MSVEEPDLTPLEQLGIVHPHACDSFKQGRHFPGFCLTCGVLGEFHARKPKPVAP
jgi:hypothetical protein